MKSTRKAILISSQLGVILGWLLTFIVTLPMYRNDKPHLIPIIFSTLTFPLGVINETFLGGDNFYSQHGTMFAIEMSAYWAALGAAVGAIIGQLRKE